MSNPTSTFSLAEFEKKCVNFTESGYSPGYYSTCIKQCWQYKCHICQAVEEIKRLQATIRRYRAMAKSIAYMAEQITRTLDGEQRKHE